MSQSRTEAHVIPDADASASRFGRSRRSSADGRMEPFRMSGERGLSVPGGDTKLTNSVGIALFGATPVDPLLICFGLGVGILVGITGMGGGALMTPILILIFGFQPTTAIGTDLAYGAVTRTLGAWRMLRQGTVNLSLSLWMAVGSVPAAVGGVVVLERLKKSLGTSFDDTVMIAVAAALGLTAGAMLVKFLLFPQSLEREREDFELDTRHKIGAVVLGLLVGFVLGVTSAGSGSLIAVGLIMCFRMAPRKVVGTDMFHASVLLWAASLAHLVAGNIDFALAGTILIGSLPGVWIGAEIMPRVPVSALRASLALVLLASALGLISKAGANLSPGVILGVPVAMGVAIYALERLRSGRSTGEPAAGTTPRPPATASAES